MQGKLVFNQSLSTFLSLNRFSKMAIPSAFVEWKAFYSKKAWSGRGRPLPISLFAQCEVRFAVARHCDRLGLVLGAFVPRGYLVTAVGDVLDFVFARLIR